MLHDMCYICTGVCVWTHYIFHFLWLHTMLLTMTRNRRTCHVLNINIDSTGLYLLGSWRFNNLTIGHSGSVVSSNNYGIYVLPVAKPPVNSKSHLASFSWCSRCPCLNVLAVMKMNPPLPFRKEDKGLPGQATHYLPDMWSNQSPGKSPGLWSVVLIWLTRSYILLWCTLPSAF